MRGFTLFEMIVTLCLASIIIISLGSVRADWGGSFRITSEAAGIRRMMQYAYQTALFKRKDMQVVINREEKSCSIRDKDGPEKGLKMKYLPNEMHFSNIRIAGLDHSEQMIRIGFYSSGYCDAALIEIKDLKGRMKILEISSLGGKMEIR